MPHGHWELFRILGVDTRLRIIELLAEKGPIGTGAIAEKLGVTPAAVSQHLSVLRHAGLVTRERKGYTVPYSVDPGGLDVCCGHLVEICSCGCGDGRSRRGACEPASTVAALKRRERELRKELKSVQERVSRLTRKDARGRANTKRPRRAPGGSPRKGR
jgi:DNA-binding transcriptional ArsR family regulator